MPQKLIILHSNDIHGRINGLAQIATLVSQIRAENSDIPVLYVDAGDSQDRSNILSRKTHGVAMYRLLKVAGCQAAAMGNKCMKRYSVEIVREYAAAGGFPILQANLLMGDGSSIPGTQSRTLFDLNGFKLGVVGVTANTPAYVKYHRLHALPVLSQIHTQVGLLRENGADRVILLSHMGVWDDRSLARRLQDEIRLIIGGHSHVLLRKGKQVGKVWLAHTGAYARRLGRIDLEWDGSELNVLGINVIPVTKEIAPSEAVLSEIEAIQQETKFSPED